MSHGWAYRKDTREGPPIPLLALDSADHDGVVDLTSITDEAFAAIWRARTGDRLRCRGCHAPVHAKRIEATGLRFFAHSRAAQYCPSQGETERHLGLKGLFADAFRRAGWQADLEVAGDDWRADVLVRGPRGQRVAVEVQLAALTLDAAQDRMRRHRVAGVTTLWVVTEKRPRWATQFSTVLLDADDLVVDTVLLAGPQPVARPAPAHAATVHLLATRWAEGRLSPAEDHEQLWPKFPGEPRVTQYFQLDQCADNHFRRVRTQRERDEKSAAGQRRAAALAKQARLPAENVMAESLTAFREWFNAQTKWKCWFGTRTYRDPFSAAHVAEWSLEVGITVIIGAFDPRYVFAVAEPHQASPKLDKRVAAWTTGRDSQVDTSGFATVYTPDCVLELANIPRDGLKPYGTRRYR